MGLQQINILALIPARAGSKGLRHKNIQCVGKHPLLVRAIQLAQNSKRSKENWSVVVSTENKAYAALAEKAGAEIPFLRPKKLAKSHARLIHVVLHAIKKLKAQGREFDLVLLLSATTPFTMPMDIQKAIDLFKRNKVSVASVVEDSIPDAWRFKTKGNTMVAKAQLRITRRQIGAANRVRLNGAFYLASPEWIEKYRQFVVDSRSQYVKMPKIRSVDIDDVLDLAWARFLRKKTGSRFCAQTRLTLP